MKGPTEKKHKRFFFVGVKVKVRKEGEDRGEGREDNGGGRECWVEDDLTMTSLKAMKDGE